MEAINLRNQDQSPLIRLPPEIRNKIYEYAIGGYIFKVFFRADTITVKRLLGNEVYHALDAQQAIEPLRLTCRFIHHETDKVRFAANKFEFYGIAGETWDHYHLNIQKFQYVKTASISTYRSKGYCLDNMLIQELHFLKRLKGLKRVEVNPPVASIADAFSPSFRGATESTLSWGKIVVKLQGVFETGRVGQAVELVEVAPYRPRFRYFGKP